MINQFFQIIGMLTCALMVICLIARLYYGKQWYFHLGLSFFAGPMLIKAIKKLYKEFPDKIKRDTLAEVTGQVIIRLTRIGIIGFLVAVIPIWLLMQQNGLLLQQNDKFDLQNDLLKTQNQSFRVQNGLLKTQNEAFLVQNELSKTQNEKFDLQNSLLGTQNEKFDLQNERFNLQNNLLEADRRSSLVFLMSNILDKVDDEIREQTKEIKENGGSVTNSTKYSLSKLLINRIVALSKAFRPYRMMEGNNLSESVSPERGQLFIALMGNNLDSTTQNTIVKRGDFSQAIIGNISILDAQFNGANLTGAEFTGAELTYVSFILADLRKVNFSGSTLWKVDFFSADLHEANFNNAILIDVDFLGAKNFTKEQLKSASSLYKCKNLPPLLRAQLEKEKPCLFSSSFCPTE